MRPPEGPIAGFEIHPAAGLVPMMLASEFEELVASIRTGGLVAPIVVTGGKILDGRNRALACEKLGIKPLSQEWRPTRKGQSATEWALATNVHRRQLTTSQRAMIAQLAMPLLQEEAKVRQRDHGNTAPGRPKNTQRKPAPGVIGEREGKASNAAAAVMNVSPRMVEMAHKVARASPALAEAVIQGGLTVNAAAQAVKVAASKASTTAHVLGDQFPVIAITPHWERPGTVEVLRGIEPPACVDCVLWLSAPPMRLLNGDVQKIIKGWGFEARSLLTWATSGAERVPRTSHVVMAVRGNPNIEAVRDSAFVVVESAGSELPTLILKFIETQCRSLPRLHVFTDQNRDGWSHVDSLANKADSRQLNLLEMVADRKGAHRAALEVVDAK